MRLSPDYNTLYITTNDRDGIRKVDLSGSPSQWTVQDWVMNFNHFIRNFALRPDGGTIIVLETCDNGNSGDATCNHEQFWPGKKTMLYEVNTASAVVTPIGSIITNSSYGNKPYLAFDFIENPYPTLPGFVVAPDGQSVYISQNSQSASASELINKIWHVDISMYREGTRAPYAAVSYTHLRAHET